MAEPTAIDVVLQMARILESLEIPYYVGGSLASTMYGKVRTTQDVDLIADIRPEHIQPLISALGSDFYADGESILEAIQKRRSFNLIHYHSIFKVDVFIPKGRPFDQEQLARRAKRQFTEESADQAFVASPEGTILAKLEWYRMGHEVSDRQWTDILGVFEVRRDELDVPYMRRWAAELGVADLLERALTAAA